MPPCNGPGSGRALRELAELDQGLTNEAFSGETTADQVNMVRIVFIIVGPAIGILLGLWAARSLNYSLSQISVTLRDASGGLEQEIGRSEVNSSDEEGGLPALQRQVQYVSGRIKQVVEELQWTRRKAVHSERLAVVGELAAGIAHEVRNPLTSVKLLIQTIERNQSATATGSGCRSCSKRSPGSKRRCKSCWTMRGPPNCAGCGTTCVRRFAAP